MRQKKLKKFSDLIWEKRDSLSSDFCKKVIQKFDEDPRKYKGIVGDQHYLDNNIKTSVDLLITGLRGWSDEDSHFHNTLGKGLQEYCEYLGTFHKSLGFHLFGGDGNMDYISDAGYQIQRTDPGGFYVWHRDDHAINHKTRVATYIWYLNDVVHDGYTEFMDGTKIQPEEGKLLIFPSSWEYLHRGYPPKSEVKYICTGWIYSEFTN